MAVLRSYVSGEWHTAAGDGVPLHDATTGEEVARISSDGVDFAGALAYGRRVGGPALRELTFHQRAALLKALASHLREHREELYALSARTGATLGDSKFDIDGGIGVLFSYASKGKRELPNDTVYVEGNVEPLSRGGTFVAQHIATPLRGVAVQINAFNFPVWGPLEKFAPAFLAGVPSLVKPASQTAYLTARLVELIIESGILPEGSLQFVAGSVGDLLDHVTAQDLVSFTGSASTAQKLRAHPAIIRNAVRFNAEADSLNCSILGPDAVQGTTEFDLFVKQLTSEMTVKAGQKCTAIRRAFVPASLLDDVAEAASRAAGEGHRRQPHRRGCPDGRAGQPGAARGGPAVAEGAAGRRERRVRRPGEGRGGRRRTPSAARSSPRCCSRPTRSGPSRTRSRRSARSRRSCPTRPPSRSSTSRRAVAAAWPARSSAPTRSSSARSSSARRRSTAACWSWTPTTPRSRPATARRCRSWSTAAPAARAAARRWAASAACCTTCSAPPCRARPAVLSAVTGRWVTGAPRTEGDVHPFRKSLAELKIGDSVVAGPRTVSQEDVDHFAEFTGDTFYAHTDPEAAAANPLFGGIVAHGYLVVSFAAGLFVSPEPGPVLANYGLENLRFLTPVKVGDSLTVTLTAKQITPRIDQEYGEVRWDADVTNADGESVAKYDVLTLVSKEQP